MAQHFRLKINLNKLLEKRERTADGVPFSSWDVISGKVREVRTVTAEGETITEYRRWKPTKRLARIMAGDARKCEAMTRKGTPCQMQVTPGRARCRLHGGLSTGPRTEAGREAIRESNRRRAATRKATQQESVQRLSCKPKKT